MVSRLWQKFRLLVRRQIEMLAALLTVQMMVNSGIVMVHSLIITVLVTVLVLLFGVDVMYAFYRDLDPLIHKLICLSTIILLFYFIFMTYEIFFNEPHLRGGAQRRSEAIRKSMIWQYAAKYFPISLIKTVDIDPRGNYIMACHPHGLFTLGAFLAFGTEGAQFGEIFPGITPHLVTVKLHLMFPISREIFLGFGMSEASKENIEWVLTRLGSGNSAVVVVGGIKENLETAPGLHRIVLRDRKGFVRMAIKTGSSLIPIYSFGENELYSLAQPIQSSLLRRFLAILEKFVGYRMLEMHDKGRLLEYLLFPRMPHRHPVTIVVGSLIPVVQCSNPDEFQVEEVHRRYMKGLKQLFDDHKHKYDENPTAELEFI